MLAVKRLLKPFSKGATSNLSSRGILTALCLATLLNALAVSSVNIALPELVADLGTTYARTQWIIVAFMIFLTAALAIAGRASDKVGRKKIFVHGMLLFSVSTLLCALSPNIWVLVLFRALQGIGAAMFTAVSMAIASDVYSRARVGTVVGLLGSISAVGTGSGPVLGGLLLEVSSWQAIFLVKVPLGVIVYWLAQKYLPEDARYIALEQARHPRNILAAFCIFSAILFYTLSIKPLNDNYGIINILTFLLSAIGVLGLYLSRGIDPGPALGGYVLYTNLATNLLVAASVMSSLVVGPFYLTLALGLSFSQTGLVMSTGSFVVAVCSNIAGRLVDRFRSRSIVIIGLFFLVLGSLGMANLQQVYGVAGYLVCSIAMAIGYGIYLSSNNTFTMNGASRKVKGSISGLLNLSRNLGLLTGASLMSVVFAKTSHLSYLSSFDSGLVVSGLNQVYLLALLFLVIAFIAQTVSILVSRKL
ncbi:MFS transporter [Microbulbifer sp. VTAC004]|uniref:MFS transporter n=1 Tax=Microbulbifer sp. VTAC004 TaxID=3243386 RepID=UPI004039137D